jgi:hypothetical protein
MRRSRLFVTLIAGACAFGAMSCKTAQKSKGANVSDFSDGRNGNDSSASDDDAILDIILGD